MSTRLAVPKRKIALAVVAEEAVTIERATTTETPIIAIFGNAYIIFNQLDAQIEISAPPMRALRKKASPCPPVKLLR